MEFRPKNSIKRRRMAKNIAADTKGVTAVEFGLISPIFFAILFSAFELALLLTKIVLMDTAASEISRFVYIGSASDGTVTMQDLEDRVCNTINLIDSNCQNNLTIELTTITDFQSIPTSAAICKNSGSAINPTVSFDPGTTNNIVYMRLCLTTDVYTPGIGLGLSFPKTNGGQIQIVSALAFSNEPF